MNYPILLMNLKFLWAELIHLLVLRIIKVRRSIQGEKVLLILWIILLVIVVDKVVLPPPRAVGPRGGGFGGNNGVQGGSAGGIGSSSNSQGTGGGSDIRVRPVNAMSLTQMCNPVIEDKVQIIKDTVHVIEPLDKESLTKVKQVLTDERDAFKNKNPGHKGRVHLKDLDYTFRGKNSSGSVIYELII